MSSSLATLPDTLIARGMDARVELVAGQVRIHRSGLMGLLITVLGHGDGLGEKTIPVRLLASVEIVRTFILGVFCFEYLRLSYAGSPERGGSAWRDAMLENVVVMGLFDNRDFYALKAAIEREMEEIRRYGGPMDPGPDSAAPAPAGPPATREPWSVRAGRWAANTYGGVVGWSGASPRRWWKGTAAAGLAAILGLGWVWFSKDDAARSGSPAFVDNLSLRFITNGTRQVTWDAGGGVIYRATVRGRALDDFVEFNRVWADERRRQLDASFQERLAIELEPVFADVEKRISEYGEWVFNWWTSYILMVRGAGAIWSEVANGGEKSLEEIVERVMADAIKERYIEIVLPPERFRPALQKAVVRASAETAQELKQACLDMLDRFRTVVTEQGAGVELQASDGTWAVDRDWRRRLTGDVYCPTPSQTVNATVADLQTAAESTFGNTGAIDDVAIRITRPVVTTIVSAGLSASSLAAVATGIGIPAALVATPAMAAVLTKSAFTLVDLMLSELDEALNRTAFEAVVRGAVARARIEFEQTVHGALRAAVVRELGVMGIEPLRQSRPGPVPASG
jgi:hypothetical protein